MQIGVDTGGTFTDLLLINGEPLNDISILEDPQSSLALIMKDGKIVKRLDSVKVILMDRR